MASLVASLLHFSRRRPSVVAAVHLAEEVIQTEELIHFHLAKCNVRVVLDFQPDLPPVMADPQQLRQVFLNLLNNASDAMPRGGEIRVVAWVEPEGHVTVEVQDKGCGIPTEHVNNVMMAFYTTKPEGTGLGFRLGGGTLTS